MTEILDTFSSDFAEDFGNLESFNLETGEEEQVFNYPPLVAARSAVHRVGIRSWQQVP